ncbi:hypothetical protein MMC25_004241 [Agyrium rufum]|nr:hypothetical protein [Agyrium rufum]
MVHSLLFLAAMLASAAAGPAVEMRAPHKPRPKARMEETPSVVIAEQMYGTPTTASVETTLASGETVIISVGITIVASTNGGDSNMTMLNAPSMAMGMTHQVTVGGEAGLVYTPSTISAAVGDMVQFNFLSQNHTVTQSSFGTPCEAMEGGADTGFMPNPNNTVSPPPAMMMQVTAATPMWFYCRQKGHCGKGMVFSINPTAAKSQQMFLSMAIAQNGTASAAAPPPPAYSTMSSTSSMTTMAAPPPPSMASSAAVAVATMVTGSGTSNGDTCSCSCLCGANSFPVGIAMGNFGGMPGIMPNSTG